MKRKGLVWVLCLVLVFSLFSALAVPANAASYSYSAMVGDSVWWVFDVPNMEGNVSLSGGSLPPGLSFGLNQDCYIILGTPTAAGDYHVTTQYNSGGTWMQDSISITIKNLVTPTPAPTVPPILSRQTPTPEATQKPVRPTPEGLTRPTAAPTQAPASTAPTAAPATAAPTQAPASTAPTAAPTAAPATATPQPGAFAITKHPSGETVTVGGSAAFVANAQNYAWCAWRFVSPDGKTEVIFDVTEPHFPGLKVEGGNALTMSLSNIPMELNGWKAVCLFCDKGNQWHYTDGTAVITVEAAATATPEPTEAPTATPESTEAPTATPAPTEVPAEAPTAEPAEPAVNTEPVVKVTPEPEAKPEKSGGFVLYILIALVLLALIAGVVLFLLAKKRREEEEAEARRADARARRAAMGGTAGAAAKTGRKWTCAQCGTVNTGKFCTDCGKPFDSGDSF